MTDILDDELEGRRDNGNTTAPMLSPDAIEALLLTIAAKVERLDEEREWYRDTLKRIEDLCQRTLVEVAREKKDT